MELEPMMSIRDVAQTLGVHRNTVMAMVKKTDCRSLCDSGQG